ncbi:MAG TPA: hypothetical protein DD435_13940, partial [Cyanobacteria bacterium UBA8530]|nr:hypothetical protein [Cyanobacteria bacterium UBA8530]
MVEEVHEEAEVVPEHHEEEVVFSELELQVLENEKPAPTLIKQPKKDESRPVVKPKPPETRRPGKHQDRRDRRPPVETTTSTVAKIVKLSGSITVKDLAEKMGLRETEIIKRLFIKGIMATINQTLEIETAEMIATEFGYAFELVDPTEAEIIAEEAEDED